MDTNIDKKHDSITELYAVLGTVVYVATIGIGSYGEYRENSIFCSTDKEKVEKWVNRLNKIIEDNTERIKKYECCEKEQPFWYDYINWESPNALMREIPVR